MIQKHFEDIVLKKFGFEFSPTQKRAVELFAVSFSGEERKNFFFCAGMQERVKRLWWRQL